MQSIPQDAVLTVGEFCKLVTDSEKGSMLSFVGTASTAVSSFPPGPPPLHQTSDSPIWPALVSTEALHGVSVFQLQPGADNSMIWTVQGEKKTLKGMNISMEDHHCIIFDDTCDNLTIQDAKFEGRYTAVFKALYALVFGLGYCRFYFTAAMFQTSGTYISTQSAVFFMCNTIDTTGCLYACFSRNQ